MKRIANHKVSKRIDAWGIFIRVLSILSIIGGIITTIAAAADSEPYWSIGLAIIFSGLLLMAGAKIIEGFSIVVHNAEQQSVDSGDNTYLDFVRKEEEKLDSETPAILDKES